MEKAGDIEDDLEALEHEILDEVAEIDERWRAAAKDVEPLSIRAEAMDVRVVDARLVWVPSD
jgi:hypothetical protein